MENTKTNQVNQEQATPQANGQTEKLFTQDELNRILTERLKREQMKYIRAANTRVQQKEAELIEREKKLAAREMRLNCREYVKEKGFPAEQLDALNTCDFEGFKKKADGIYAALGCQG